MSSLLVFTPDITQPSETVSAEITTTQMDAVHLFITAQNDDTPDKYPTELSLFMSNLRDGLLTATAGLHPPPPETVPSALSGIVFVPDPLNPGDNLQGDTFLDTEMRPLATFVAAQNADEPGKYAGNLDVMMSNLHDALLAALVGLYPPSTVSSAQAGVATAQATLAAAVASANPRATVAADPVAVPPYES